MHTSLFYTLAATVIHIGVTSAASYAGSSTDGKALSMIEIVQRLEHDGYGPFTELSMDDGHWEVEVRKQDESLELIVDPISGNVLSHHRDDAERTPPSDAMPLSVLLQTISERGSYKQFDEVSFEHRYWEVEVYKDGQKRELHVDPMTAKVIADRIDN